VAADSCQIKYWPSNRRTELPVQKLTGVLRPRIPLLLVTRNLGATKTEIAFSGEWGCCKSPSVLLGVLFVNLADPSGRAVWGVGLRPLACWDCRFESRRGACLSVCCECCVLSGRGLCDGLIIRPEESYRAWCVWVWSRSLDNEQKLHHRGLLHHGENANCYGYVVLV
jgi:hypothetical protein